MNQVYKVQSSNREVNQLQDNLLPVINTLAALPLLNGNLLTSVSLAVGSNSINHLLNRPLQGWIIVRKRASATIWDTQDSNTTPALTLQLSASTAVVVDILVY